MVKVKHTSLMVCSFVYCRQHYIPSPTLYPTTNAVSHHQRCIPSPALCPIALYPVANAGKTAISGYVRP